MADIELDEPCKAGFDTTKYNCWWQDPDYKAHIVNKREIAEFLDVSLMTIDNWIRKGAPVISEGNSGIPCKISSAAFIEWHMAHRAGISIEEFRQYQLKEARQAKERGRIERLEADNKRLK